MATPAMELERRSRVIENDPATAAATAIPRSIKLGDVRPMIFDCTLLIPSIRLSREAVPTTAAMPNITVTAERRINLPSLTARPKARLRIGSIKGATIMAPITTAVLLEINPKVAMTAEQTAAQKSPGKALKKQCASRKAQSEEPSSKGSSPSGRRTSRRTSGLDWPSSRHAVPSLLIHR